MIYGWNVLELWQVFGALSAAAAPPEEPPSSGASAGERPRAASASRLGCSDEEAPPARASR